jgi:tRNA threonylcarbamoyladenosine dehydratase
VQIGSSVRGAQRNGKICTLEYAYLSPPFGARAPPANRVPFYSSLPLTTAAIALLYDDFALGRSIVPPHTACVRLALVRWDPSVPLSLENCVVGEMKEVSRAMLRVFAMPDSGAVYEEIVGLNRAQGYVDALGEPIDPARFDNGVVIWSSEEVWGIEAARVAQFRIAQARRFREWALQ